MKIDEYISCLREKNVIISVQDGSIAVNAPPEAINPAIIAELTAKKQEILSFFESVKANVENKLTPSKAHESQENITYEEGQYEVLAAQAWRYRTRNTDSYQRLQFLIQEKLDHIDEKAFFKAMDTLVERHENLRTLFLDKEGVVLQQIYPSNAFKSNISFIDISLIAQDKKEETIRIMIDELCQHIFDFKNERAFKCKLIKYDKDKYYFTFLMDHMIYDARSIDIIKTELFTLYDCYSKGIPNPLKPLKLHFRDYVQYHNQHSKGNKLRRHQSFYLNLFKDKPPKLYIEPQKVSFGKASENQTVQTLQQPEKDNHGGGNFTFIIPKETSNEIQNFTSECKISLFNFLLANYSILLSKLSNQNDFVFFSPISTRHNDDFLKIVGWVAGMLISRVKIEKNQTFRELLFHCRKVVAEAMDHIHYEDFPSDLDSEWEQLLSAQLNQRNDFDSANSDLLDNNPYHSDSQKPPLDINFNVQVYKNGIEIMCQYNREAISKSQISGVCNKYLEIIKANIASPDTKI